VAVRYNSKKRLVALPVFDWVIVGGGIHGVTIATFLLNAAEVPREKLLIVDPNEALLLNWTQQARAVGMKALRSASVHHLDVDPFSLKKFADSREGRRYGKLRGKYGHPDVELFGAHCSKVIEENVLEAVHLKDTVIDLKEGVSDELKNVVLTKRTISSRNVVLALGNPAPAWPVWTEDLASTGKTVVHAFDSTWDRSQFRGSSVAVVGGGPTCPRAS